MLNELNLDIETPESITFNYDIAGIGTRFLALFIDTLIQACIFILMYLGVLALVISTGELDRGRWFLVAVILAIFLVYTLYFVAFEMAMNGQTPGKRAIGLRVVKENGYPLTALDVIVRNLVRLVDFFPAAYSLGFIVMLFNERSKRLGDFAAGTLVIRDRKPIKLADVQAALQHQQANLQTASTAANNVIERDALTRLHEPDIQMIESFLQRRLQLAQPSALAKTIADAIATRLQDSEWVAQRALTSDEEFLKGVVAAYRNYSSVHSQTTTDDG